MTTIRATKGRAIHAHRERSRDFTQAKMHSFLGNFAATGNVLASAAKVGVSRSTIYMRRQQDPAFRDAFAIAEENSIITLRAEMVRRSLDLLAATTPDEVAAASLPGLDCRTIMVLLQQHEKGLGKGPGDRQPQRSDPNEAAARLAKLLERMRAEHKRDLAVKRAARTARTAAQVSG